MSAAISRSEALTLPYGWHTLRVLARLRAYVVRVVGRADAEDVFGQLVVYALEVERRYNPAEDGPEFWGFLRSFLRAMTFRAAVDIWACGMRGEGGSLRGGHERGKRVFPTRLGALEDPDAVGAVEPAASAFRCDVSAFLEGRSAREREVVAGLMQGQTLEEIGTTLGIRRQRVQEVWAAIVAAWERAQYDDQW